MNEASSQIDVLVLDISKAFDMMPLQRLLQKFLPVTVPIKLLDRNPVDFSRGV